MTRTKFIRAAVVAASLMVAGAASAQTNFYGLTRENSGRNLVTFTSAMPGMFSSNIAITGAVTSTGKIVDLFSLDLNTSNGALYSLGDAGSDGYGLYRIGYDGVATKVGDLGVNLGTENVGLDYDSVQNVFRVVTNDDKLYNINPTTGAATLVGTINYVPGDPRGQSNPNITAAAFNGQLYVLDKNAPGAQTTLLSTLSGTTLTSRAVVGLQIDTNASFDIGPDGQAFFDSGVVSDRLYSLNLTNGSFTDLGALQSQLTGLTVAGIAGAVPEPATWLSMILGFGLIGGTLRRRRTGKLATA